MSDAKKAVKGCLGTLAKAGAQAVLGRGRGFILTYHRIIEGVPDMFDDPALCVSRASFEMHLRELSRWCEIVTLDEVLDVPAGARSCCAITFDDGWLDNYEVALPVLESHGVPATVFLPVAMIGTGRTFWFRDVQEQMRFAERHCAGGELVRYYRRYLPQWRAEGSGTERTGSLVAQLKGLEGVQLADVTRDAYRAVGRNVPESNDLMTWEQVREMSGKGVSFGSHGLRHNILPRLDSATRRKEIVGSLGILRRKTLRFSAFLSYPNGDWDDDSIRLAATAGYRGGVTTQVGYNRPGGNPFLLRRVGLHEEICSSPALFWFRILQAVTGAETT